MNTLPVWHDAQTLFASGLARGPMPVNPAAYDEHYHDASRRRYVQAPADAHWYNMTSLPLAAHRLPDAGARNYLSSRGFFRHDADLIRSTLRTRGAR